MLADGKLLLYFADAASPSLYLWVKGAWYGAHGPHLKNNKYPNDLMLWQLYRMENSINAQIPFHQPPAETSGNSDSHSSGNGHKAIKAIPSPNLYEAFN